MTIKDSRAYKYCKEATKKTNKKVPIYVKKQAKAWLDIVDGKDDEAYADDNSYSIICDIMELMIHPDLGVTIYESCEDYAFFMIVAAFCTKLKADDSRYYQTVLLEIARKNYKTFYSAVIFIIGMLCEPRFGRLFSVAPDYKLSSELKLAVNKIIKSSPDLERYFKLKRDEITCNATDIVYMPLAYSNDKMDGKLANIFLADEVGAMDNYPIEAMRSSQVNIKNKLGIIISTQYPNDNNALIDEIDMAKKTLDGLRKNKRYFSLLYEPDKELINKWQTNDLVIYQSNPVAINNPVVFDSIKEARENAIEYDSKKANYLCKHNNIFYRSVGAEGFVDTEALKRCKAEIPADFWQGKRVFVGVDLSQSDDNTAVYFVTEENGIVYCNGMCFIPKNKVDIKSKKEKLDYRLRIEAGEVTACGDNIIDYAVVEDYVLNLEEKYGVIVEQIGFDRYNAMSSVQKWERAGYECVEVRQHSSVTHSPTKLLKEKILKNEFRYSENRMLEINFENAVCVEDTNRNKYIHKKKSGNKIDIVASIVNAMYLLEQDLLNNTDFVCQFF